MIPLIDADVLRYEIGFSGEYVDDEGKPQIRDFEFVAELLDQKIKEICGEVWSTEPPILFLTMDRRLHKKLNKQRDKEIKKARVMLATPTSPEDQVALHSRVEELIAAKEYKPNFRDAIAVKKEYKGNRKASTKPFHYDNLTAYMLTAYECQVAIGMEADDLMSIYQYERIKQLDTIICSRDKDLRITPGMQFGWPCGRQPQFGPKRVTELGELTLSGNNKKLSGDGLKFFYSQVLTGDTVDNIPGLPRCGPVKAFATLSDCTSEDSMFGAVASLYELHYGDGWHSEMNEQCQLLWMVRELDEEGNIVQYKMYDER